MNWNFFSRRIRNVNTLFNGHYVDAKSFYVLAFDKVPCVTFIGEMDVTRAFAHINEVLKNEIKEIYQHAYFDHTDRKVYFNNTVFVLKNRRMIELGNNFCHILHGADDYEWANAVVKELAAFRIISDETPTRVIGFARQPEVLN